MHKTIIALTALAAATAGHAAVPLNFNSVPGNLGNSHSYTVSGLTVVATGYASNGVQTALFGKNAGGDENGLGLYGYTDNEITGPGTDFIQLDVNSILASVSSATFFSWEARLLTSGGPSLAPIRWGHCPAGRL